MQSPVLLRSLVVSASILVHPDTDPITGVRGEPENAFNLLVAPIDPLSPEIVQRYALTAPFQYKVTYAFTNEVIEQGMYLKVGTKEYPIRGVGPYQDGDKTFYELVLEDVKAE